MVPTDSSTVAWVFPGQGSQAVSMGKALYDAYPRVRELYGLADMVLGYSISDLCFSGPAEELQQTVHAQPALLVTEIAHLYGLRLRYPGEYELASFVAGHSLGEYSALVAAGALAFKDALTLVAERGKLMQEAGSMLGQPTGMVAIIGLAEDQVGEICQLTGVDLANINAPGQVVLSGPVDALEKAQALARERGARRAVPLAVSAAFHSRWMRSISSPFGKHIAQTRFADPRTPVIANVTARPMSGAAEIRKLLEEQTYSPVRWVESVQFMVDQGATTFVEVGPGKVLTGLIKRITPQAQTISSEDLLSGVSAG